MPTRKQRRREAKLRRHEWEEVYLDPEGNEVPVEEVAPEKSKASAKDGRQVAKPSRNGRKTVTDSRGRALRQIDPPSWRRVLRRAAIFGPIMFVALILLNSRSSAASQVAVAVVYTALLIPFMYLMDRLAYRTYLRRRERALAESKRPRA